MSTDPDDEGRDVPGLRELMNTPTVLDQVDLPVEDQEFVDGVRRHLETDPMVEAVQDECPTCGAYMLNPALHRDWHEKWRKRMSEVADQAGRYKPPPTYR